MSCEVAALPFKANANYGTFSKKHFRYVLNLIFLCVNIFSILHSTQMFKEYLKGSVLNI